MFAAGVIRFLRARCNRRPGAMRASEGGSDPGKSWESSPLRSGAEPLAEGGQPPLGRRVTEEELAIHGLHRYACQVNYGLSDDPINTQQARCQF